MKYLITGGCGFLGSNIAHKLIGEAEVIVFDNLSRLGAGENLNWLREKGKFSFVHGDIRNTNDVDTAIRKFKPDVVFHLAGQVAMTTSIENPRLDFEINAKGSFNILEAIRTQSPETSIIYSSTNKVYGDLEWEEYIEDETRYRSVNYPDGFPETIQLDFHSPYGTSKGSADQYMLDYSRIFNIKSIVFRHSSMYGGRQFATYDQGWIGWFCQKALEIKENKLDKPFTVSGNGKQVRDLLYADDMINLYITASRAIDTLYGNAYNIGGGMENSLSIRELFDFLEKELNIKMTYEEIPVRESDQKIFVADLSKIRKHLNWKPEIDIYTGLRKMLVWVKNFIK